jgi:hypothetical protein
MAALSLGRMRRVLPISGVPSALVMTVVHNPEDARIRQRQINALIAAGWNVTYVAPFRAFGLEVPRAGPADLGRGSL